MNKVSLFLFFFLIVLLSSVVFSRVEARIGVGIGTGKIKVSEKLKPGQIYTLPAVTILNTGDEPGTYSVRVTYHEKQKDLEPAEEWFIFSPKEFNLKPGAGQTVEMKLNLPFVMEPGDYFAYVEGYPTKKAGGGTTTIGVAAATKLYFTVEPANFFQAFYYRIISFWREYQPWTSRISITIILLIAFGFIKRYVNIDINFRKNKTNEKEK